MADEEKKSKKSTSKSKGKSKKSTKKSQKSNNGLKRPLSAYMLFCSKQREELKKKGDDKKLTAKELGAMWNKLSETKKKPFFEKFEAEKKKYEKMKDELESKSEEEDSEEESTGIIDVDKYKPSTDVTDADQKLVKSKVGIVLGIIRNISAVVAVISLMVIGLKYIFGSVEEKANYKQTLLPYVIGAVLAVTSTTIVSFIYNAVA